VKIRNKEIERERELPVEPTKIEKGSDIKREE
jgi:hypothetical protein